MNLKDILLPGLVACMISGCNGYALKSDLYSNFAAEPHPTKLCKVNYGNPECSFTDMPEVQANVMFIATPSTPQQALIIRGVLKDEAGMPLPNAYLYGFHSDEHGQYTSSGKEKGVHKDHGKYHGWCKTNDAGEFEIRTIHPETSSDLSPHIHLAVKLSRLKKAFFIDDLVITDSSNYIVKDIVLQ
jgi:protocatechuate 3,4-dioxygenase beta subunit